MENKIKSFVKKLSGAIKSQEQSHKDPVCGMDVKIDLNKSEYQGKTYYFCCQTCLEKFKKDPQEYISKIKEIHLEAFRFGSQTIYG